MQWILGHLQPKCQQRSLVGLTTLISIRSILSPWHNDINIAGQTIAWQWVYWHLRYKMLYDRCCHMHPIWSSGMLTGFLSTMMTMAILILCLISWTSLTPTLYCSLQRHASLEQETMALHHWTTMRCHCMTSCWSWTDFCHGFQVALVVLRQTFFCTAL